MGDASRERAALGRAARKKRRDLDLSQEAVARRGDVHVNLVGRLERGLNVETETLFRVLRGLGISWTDLAPLVNAELGPSESAHG